MWGGVGALERRAQGGAHEGGVVAGVARAEARVSWWLWGTVAAVAGVVGVLVVIRATLVYANARFDARGGIVAAVVFASVYDAARAAALVAAQDAPSTLESRKSALLDDLAMAEARRTKTSDALGAAEHERAEADRGLRAAEAAASEAREVRASLSAHAEAAVQRLQEVAANIREAAKMEPEALARTLADEAVAIPADADGMEAHLFNLERQRESIGPVNLRAEEEAGELAARLEAVEHAIANQSASVADDEQRAEMIAHGAGASEVVGEVGHRAPRSLGCSVPRSVPPGARASIVVQQGQIQWVGPDAAVPAAWQHLPRRQGADALVTPGLVDCHTHLVYGGQRANEFAMRLAGATYEEVARAGGGIVSSVKATRAASEDELFAQAAPRLQALLQPGGIKRPHGGVGDDQRLCGRGQAVPRGGVVEQAAADEDRVAALAEFNL